MPKLIFFDTETTGNTEKDYLCQIAYKTGTEIFVSKFKPPIKIPPEASAVHHITNKMIADSEIFKQSTDYQKIKSIFEAEDSIVVAHNAPFDLMVIKKEGILPKNFIDTLRIVRYLDAEGRMNRYNLQYLRYLLELEIEAIAHDALGDVLVLEKLFDWLKNKLKEAENLDDDAAIKKMVEISSHPSLLHTFTFGKYTGRSITDVLAIDRGYLEWLLAQKLVSDRNEDDWIYTLKYHLEK